MQHFTVNFRPDNKQVQIHAGATLLEAASQAGIILNTVCGAKGTCGKCVVILESAGQKVLACQYQIQSDIAVTIPQESRFLEHKILLHGVPTGVEIQPDIYKKYKKKHHADKVFGLAVDIGTTTVVAKMVDMVTGNCLGTEAALNPQTQFGDDVISRITYAQTDAKLAELHNVIINCINDLTRKLCGLSAVEAHHIYEVCVVGNTTMNHLFLKLPVEQLGRAPYSAYSLEAHDVPANKLDLKISPAGNVHTVENIAGFVGADTTAGALAVDIESAEDGTLFIDIGTNGELVLKAGGRLYAVSCAAGPAFEGARITCGSRASEGAIESLVLADNDITADVIGDGPPRSICGSGLVDAVALMLDLGIIARSGRFTSIEKPLKLPASIESRLIEKDGQPAFCLSLDESTGQPQVFLTQKDIREVQLAKAAIRAGTTILLRRSNLKDAELSKVLLAGAFGNYIRPQSAMRIDLLPRVPLERIQFVGNAAVAGAQMILLSRRCREQANRLSEKIQYIEIAHEKDFSTIFAESMLF